MTSENLKEGILKEQKLIDIKNGHGHCSRCALNLSIEEFTNHNCETMEDINKKIWEKGIKEQDLELLNDIIWSHTFEKSGDMQEEHRKLQELIKNWERQKSKQKALEIIDRKFVRIQIIIEEFEELRKRIEEEL